MSYNIITKSLDEKLNGYQEKSLGAGNYLTLLYAPPLADVYIQLNDNTAPKIPFREGDTIKDGTIDRVYITANVVSGGKLIFGQSNSNDFKIIPSPKVNDIREIGEIGSFNAELLTALDKIVNPYELVNEETLLTSSTTLTTILNKTLTCDKIVIDLSCVYSSSNYNSYLIAKIDGLITAMALASQAVSSGIGKESITLFNKKNKNLMIEGMTTTPSLPVLINIKEFNKKV